MDFIFNFILAWLSVFLGVFLSAKYLIRRLAGSGIKQKRLFQQWNKSMRRWHVPLGVIMIATGFLHGLLSSQDVFSPNLGTATWIVGIAIGISYAARKLLAKKGLWLLIHRILTLVFLILIVLHLVEVGGIRIFSAIGNHNSSMTEKIEGTAISTQPESSEKSTALFEAKNDESGTLEKYNENLFGVTLKDGIYTGTATGYSNGLTIEVTISENQVTDIAILSHNEKNSKFFGRPINEIPAKIIDTQSLDVDAVAGATYTSTGIINAVNDALSQAVISGELPPLRKLP